MAETISMPKLGFEMVNGMLVRWVKRVGESINKGDVLAEIETDKATVEVEAPVNGIVRNLLASQGDIIPVGALIAIIGTADEVIDVNEIIQQIPTSKIRVSPVARRLARSLNVDLLQVAAWKPAPYLRKTDIEAFLNEREFIDNQ